MALTVLILKISDWMMTYNRREYRQANSVRVQNNTQHLHWVISCRAFHWKCMGGEWKEKSKREKEYQSNGLFGWCVLVRVVVLYAQLDSG